MTALVALAGLVYGVAAALFVSIVVSKSRRALSAYGYLLIYVVAGLVLVLIEGLGVVRESMFSRSWADPLLYDTFHRFAVGAAVAVGSMGLWRLLSAQSKEHEPAARIASPLLVSNVLASLGGGIVVSLVAYVVASPLLPERGPLWGIPLLIAGCSLVWAFGFVAGHICWLYSMASRYPAETILEAIGESGSRGLWQRMSTAVLRRAA